MNMQKSVLFAICFALGAAADVPTVSDVTVRQRWPWSRLVDIDYVLTCEAGEKVDVTVAGYNGATVLELPMNAFSGDLYNVGQGFRRIVFDPVKTAYTNEPITRFKVALEPMPSPLYLIVDLTKNAGADGQLTYLGEAELASGTYGPVQTNPVPGVESFIWTGVTNSADYKTTKLVLRRVSAGTFTMGEGAGSRSVTLTKDYYAGVFPVTQAQWSQITGAWPSTWFTNANGREARPVENLTYNMLRGADAGANWPGDSGVDASSFLGKLRASSGIERFDLPTDAQWEYACRAGTTSYYNDGLGTPSNTDSNDQINVLGRYRFNGGWAAGGVSGNEASRDAGTTNGTAVVGCYLPNAWGLYDMHGNVWEFCLDWNQASLPGGTDPVGAATGTSRVMRGGAWAASGGTVCRSAFRNATAPGGSPNRGAGVRLVIPLP